MRNLNLTLTLAISCGLTVGASSHAGEIQWRSGTVQTEFVAPAQAAQSVAALTAARGANGNRHIVVQFDAPVDDAKRAALAASGVTLLNYLGDNSFYATTNSTRLNADGLAATNLRAAMEVQTNWKLHDTLSRGEVVPWAIVGADAAAFEREPELLRQIIVPQPGDNIDVIAYVIFHPDVELDRDATAAVQENGGVVIDDMRSINGLVVQLPFDRISALANEDAVQYIEPPLPPFSIDNSSNRARVGADTAQVAPYNLNGSGVSVLVYDGGTGLASHVDFGGRLTPRDTSGLSDHSTHVSGTVGGDGTASAGANRGMAPGVTIESYGFETGGPLEAGFLYTNPGDLEADYNQAINTFGADISNNSIGTNVAPNGFPCSWEGDYNATSSLIDAIVRGSLGAPFRIVWAGGNERGNGSCGTTYNTIAPPAGAKNHLSIGALNSNNDSVTSFTGWGPTDDGRLKPDFSAPGCQSNDDGGVTSTSSSGGYNVKCGTSMASPTVCGISALLLQDFRANNPGDPDFRNSTLKAVLAQTAVDIESPGPDYRSGYGSVRVVPAIDLMRAGNFLESELGHGETAQFLIVVGALDTELRVTLAWDDVPGTPAVNPTLVNDLDLRVIDVNSNEFLPWTLDPLNPANAAVQTAPDHRNNLEQVFINSPPPGSYLVQVTGFNVPQGPQSFSMAAGPLLINCSPQGIVEFDQPSYNCDSVATITVNDCDVNTNDLVIETVQITVESDSEPGGEIVTLTESGPQTAYFVGTIGLSTVDAGGVLNIAEGDTITATYIDADDGFGGTNVVVTSDAAVDCTPPIISSVGAINIEPRSATVAFDTDEPAAATVHYGLDCSSLGFTASAFGFNTSHAINLNQLQDDTTYYFSVEATDPAANTTIDTNGGACYSFATPEIPDFFTELFISDFDLDNQAILFAPNGSIDQYAACRFATVALPTDPTGGTQIFLGDTGSFQVNLTGGNDVLLYGVNYGSFYVNANGNITFTAADTDSTESFDDHFDTPRVSVLFDDLDPAEGGTISWKELSDRAVVTWQNVPEDGGNNMNTFQIELYYDGRIQLAWLNIAATDGLVGLSPGGGVPVDFFETDLTDTLGDCGPRPPSAAGRTVITGQDRETTFSLLASDDGLPGPLEYIVLSLPGHELRDADNGHIIVPGDLPYTLDSGEKDLTYAPTSGFLGLETFDFKVNDGGSPPNAGDSNIATVTLQVDPVLNVPFFDPFPNTSFDSNNWSTVIGATIDLDGLAEPSAPYSARFNGNPSGGDDLQSHLMDLGTAPSVRLIYYYERTGTGESPDAGENLRVEYFNTNGGWTLIKEFAGDGPDMVTYIREESLLPVGALHESFRLRFRNSGSSSTSNLDDWFIDDVSLTLGDAPIAAASSADVRQDDPTDIMLNGSDPNLDPLDFIITSLPTGGTLTDPGGGLIDSNSLPYTITTNGNVVTYQRTGDFVGTDVFNFTVSDGANQSFVVSVTLNVQPVLTLPFEDTFPALSFDSTKWSVVDGASIDGGGLNIPTPPYSARFDGTPTQGDTLVSSLIDLEGQTGIRFGYLWERTGSGESPDPGEDLIVEFFNTSGAWELFAQYDGDGPDMTDFALEDQLLPPSALHGNFKVRFSNTASASGLDDWFVDNVRVYSIDAPTASDLSVIVPKFGMAQVTFVAFDPNFDPLDYVVVTLPANGELYDVSSGSQISSNELPYQLQSGADVLYLPTLGFVGSDSFGYRANDGGFDSNLATVNAQIGGEQPIINFPLDADPGWSTEGLWEFGTPQGVSFDPVAGFTGSNVYGYNLAGKYENGLSATYLTTTPIDLSGVQNAELRYYRWLGVEANFFDHATLEISTNGVDYSLVWEHTSPSGIFDRAWLEQSYDIAAIADGDSAVQLRWSMGPTDGSGNFEGWNIDDVRIFGDLVTGPGDIDQDGDVDDADLRAFTACMFGPGVNPSPGLPMFPQDCLDAFDFDADNDVDMNDAALFTPLYTGPN